MVYKDKLIELKNERKLSQEDISNILKITRGRYSHYETEYELMSIKHLNTLCNYFKVSLDYIFNFTDIKNYSNFKENIDLKKLSLRLKEFRKENNLTQYKLATILNISRTTIAEYERGINTIATPFLYTICSKYKISADYLLGKIDNPKYLK